MSGHPEFIDIRNEFYKDAQGCILVYDTSSRTSFAELDDWFEESEKFGIELTSIPTIICANKVDKKRAVSEDEGKLYALNKGMKYYETSALSGICVADMFLCLFEKIVDNAKIISATA